MRDAAPQYVVDIALTAEQAVTPAEIAIMLQVSKGTVARGTAAGEIPGFGVGRQWRFWPSQVRAHFEEKARKRRDS